MNNIEIPWLLPALYWIIGVAFGYVFQSLVSRLREKEAKHRAETILEDAEREKAAILREAEIEARNEVVNAREQFEREVTARRRDMDEMNARTSAREAKLDERATALDHKESALAERSEKLDASQKTIREQMEAARAGEASLREQLAKVAHLPQDQARKQLLESLDKELTAESAAAIRRAQSRIRESAEAEARRLVAIAAERYAADQIADMTTSSIRLPSDEMKARIIGKEGRNVRAIEAATGVDVIIDDTPEVVAVSSFDPVRREVARQAIEQLVQDGRIHPGRIEEVVLKAQGAVEETVKMAGEAAVSKLGLHEVHPDLARLVGSLKFRHSYGQNVLEHSIETAHLMGMMAAEMGLDAALAKRIGLFHDVGKAMDQSKEGSHAQAGATFLSSHGEDEIVCNAVAAHHNEAEGESVYAVLIKAADALTAARPGARSEATDAYVQRLGKLEQLAHSQKGVDRCFAIQAGRELRVIVHPDQISDDEAIILARNLCKMIEEQLDYPGQIKVTVVRETRAIEYAR